MFKNIQKKLLLENPIIWNTKLVPMLLIVVLLHLIFFALGYYEGTIDFTNQTKVDIEVSAILFGILLIILITILWLVHYFKNNSLKTFYTKSKNSLFYEWLQVFIVCLLLITFFVSFQIGEQLHHKSYYSKEETIERCKIISQADVFIDGYFKRTEIDSIVSNFIGNSTKNIALSNQNQNNVEDVTETYAEETVDYSGFVYKDHVMFKNKKYDENSLINRQCFEFYMLDEAQDSLNNLEVKNWLFEDNQKEVKNLMNTYLSLIKEHQLATNLNVEKWFKITYNKPEFKDFLYIVPFLKEYETEDSYSYNSNYSKSYINHNNNKYSKYFVQQDVLKNKYQIVSKAHTNPFIEFESVLAYLFAALGFSLLLFSFRVTSSKSWLIALVSFGVLNIIFGVITAVLTSEMAYLYFVLFSILGAIIYFFVIYFNQRSIQLSKIALNLFLWTFGFLIPIVYFLIFDNYKRERNLYKNYNSPEYNWFNTHILEMLTANFAIAIIVIFVMSRIIRNWKGMPEE